MSDVPIAGIGPVITAYRGGAHVYYYDVAHADGSIRRISVPKRGRAMDLPAKRAAYHARITLANSLRDQNVALIHDQKSFDAFVFWLRAPTLPLQAAVRLRSATA